MCSTIDRIIEAMRYQLYRLDVAARRRNTNALLATCSTIRHLVQEIEIYANCEGLSTPPTAA